MNSKKPKNNLPDYYNRYSLIRSLYAGVWFGKIVEREGNKIKIENALRMLEWNCNKSKTLSGTAMYGVQEESAYIVGPVKSVWLTDIEILECSEEAIESILKIISIT